MAYNPYNSAKKIVEEKQKWANAKAKGEDTSAFEQSAKVYYDELINNGRGDVADYLKKSDSVKASEYLKSLTPSYAPDAGSLQQKSDDHYGDVKRYTDDIVKSYDKVYDNNINVDPTATDYGRSILGGYGIAANEAYKGTLGGKSADNGGNVDSFAAANANRQKSAVLSEGYGNVLDYYNSIAGNARTWAGDKATAVGGMLDRGQVNVDSDRDVVKQAFAGTVDMFKTQNTNEANKAISEGKNDAEKYGVDKEYSLGMNTLASNEKINREKIESNERLASTTPTTDYGKWAKDMLGNVVSRNTSDTYIALPKSGVENEYEYKSSGKKTNTAAVAREVEDILNSDDLPYEQRRAMYLEAIGNGYDRYLSSDTKSRYGGVSGGTSASGYDAAVKDIASGGDQSGKLDKWLAYAGSGMFSDSQLIAMAEYTGTDISEYIK